MGLRKLIEELFNFLDWNTSLEGTIITFIMTLIWVLLGMLLVLIGKLVVNRYLKHRKRANRTITLIKFFNGLVSVIIWIIMMIVILNEFGVEVGPIITSAGIVTFTIGFGAQELIKDIISGIFIISDQTYDIGDIVLINGYKGMVTEIGFRKTKLLSQGDIVSINNGRINDVTNFSLTESRGVVLLDITMPFDLDVFESVEFKNLLTRLSDNELMKAPLTFEGVTASKYNYLTVQFLFRAATEKHYGLQKQFSLEISKYINQYLIKKVQDQLKIETL